MISNKSVPYIKATAVCAVTAATAATARRAGVNPLFTASAAFLAAATVLLVDSFTKPKPDLPDLPNDIINKTISYQSQEDLSTLNSVGGAEGSGTDALIHFFDTEVDPHDLGIVFSFANLKGVKPGTLRALDVHIRKNVIPNLPHTFGPSHTARDLYALNNIKGLKPATRQILNAHVRDNILLKFPRGLAPTAIHEQLSPLYKMEELESATQRALDALTNQTIRANLNHWLNPTTSHEEIDMIVGDINKINTLGWNPEPQQSLDAHMTNNVIPRLGPDHINLIANILNPTSKWGPEVLEAAKTRYREHIQPHLDPNDINIDDHNSFAMFPTQERE